MSEHKIDFETLLTTIEHLWSHFVHSIQDYEVKVQKLIIENKEEIFQQLQLIGVDILCILAIVVVFGFAGKWLLNFVIEKVESVIMQTICRSLPDWFGLCHDYDKKHGVKRTTTFLDDLDGKFEFVKNLPGISNIIRPAKDIASQIINLTNGSQ